MENLTGSSNGSYYTKRRPGARTLSAPISRIFNEYLSDCLKTGVTYLYVNNTFLHKKDHGTKFGFPTHFLVLLDIRQSGDTLTIKYWDYGGRSLQQVSTAFLKKILFGVTHCTKKLT